MADRSVGLLVMTFLFLTLVGGCVMPSPNTAGDAFTAQPSLEAGYTEAVQTVIVQLTKSASGIAPTNLPDETAVSQSTATLTPESKPSPTISLTPTAAGPSRTPTQTLLPSDPKSTLGNPTWVDFFDNDDNWYLLVDEHSIMMVEDGKMSMEALIANSLDWWALTWPKVNNFYLEAAGSFGTCAELDRFGVIVRAPVDATRGYLYGLSCDGRYSLWIMDTVIPKKTVLVDWTPSPYIHPGTGMTNRLGLMVKDGQFSLFVNGNLLGEVSDGTFSHDYFGLFVGAAKTPGFTAFVDEIAYWYIP